MHVPSIICASLGDVPSSSCSHLFCCAALCCFVLCFVAQLSFQGEAAAKADLTSASLLNLLVSRQRSLAGDRSGQQLVGQLLEAAAEPYFGILRQWMCTGVLDDPYGEFMVKVGGWGSSCQAELQIPYGNTVSSLCHICHCK
jgi:hypothetical protein